MYPLWLPILVSYTFHCNYYSICGYQNLVATKNKYVATICRGHDLTKPSTFNNHFNLYFFAFKTWHLSTCPILCLDKKQNGHTGKPNLITIDKHSKQMTLLGEAGPLVLPLIKPSEEMEFSVSVTFQRTKVQP